MANCETPIIHVLIYVWNTCIAHVSAIHVSTIPVFLHMSGNTFVGYTPVLYM